MRDTGSAFLNYLDRIQLPIGSEIRIQAIIEFDNSMEILVNGSRSITISKQVADNLLVVKK
jgi:DtxR family Mn-dependent transcriptional regulator